MTSQKLVLAFTGRMASGKGTAVSYFIEKHGAALVKTSAPLRDILDRLYLEQSRGNMQDLSTVLRKRFGQNLLSSVFARDASRAEASLVVVDGVRRPADIEDLQKLPGFTLLAIDADQKIRFGRIRKRGENPDDASKTWEEFLKEEDAETEITLPEIMAQADVHIDNSGTVEGLYAQLEAMYVNLKNRS